MTELTEMCLNEMSALRCIKMLADRVKGKKLKNVSSARPLIDTLMKKLPLASREEVLAFVAVFDHQCEGSRSDIDDIGNYFDCGSLEAMELMPALLGMKKKGLLSVNGRHENRLTQMRFGVEENVVDCIVAGRKVKCNKRKERKIDQYELCVCVSSLVEDEDVSYETVVRRTEEVEREGAGLKMVKTLKAKRIQLEDRILFYEICHDFIQEHDSEISSTLNDLYDNVADRTKARRLLVGGTHSLIKAELIELTGKDNFALTDEGLRLLYGEDAALYGVKNGPLDRYGFVEAMEKAVERTKDVQNHEWTLTRKVLKMETANSKLSFIGELGSLSTLDRLTFYLVANAFTKDTCLDLDELDNLYDKHDAFRVKNSLYAETHPLQKQDLVETVKSGFFNETCICLTDTGKELFLGDDMKFYVNNATKKDMIACDKIQMKRLFFDSKTESQLQLVRNSLEDKNYHALRDRLKEKKMNEGIAVLLYGAPGTGKTESVLQIARETGRDVMHVDISQTKSCWFGESEKKIKEIFRNYRRMCKQSKRMPILLFNEADAVFSKRKEADSSNVTQTENAIQNIILEEMERLDGILVATTNLADNLDSAFERRFLFKIRYERPSTDAKRQIWRDKMPSLSEEDARALAETYNFSGGEIDNIVRKVTMKELVEGTPVTGSMLRQLCQEERIASHGSRKFGFI